MGSASANDWGPVQTGVTEARGGTREETRYDEACSSVPLSCTRVAQALDRDLSYLKWCPGLESNQHVLANTGF